MKISEMNLDRLMSMTWEEKWNFVCSNAKDDGASGEVALVLGTDPQEALLRVQTAARLFHEGRVKYIIPSGGVKWQYQGESISEAELMTRELILLGVPKEVVFPDLIAQTTVENMIGATLVIARNIKIRNIKNVLLVTSQFHMQRSLFLAKALLPRKFSVHPCPTLPKESREEWLLSKTNQKRLNTAIRLIKGLVTNGVVEDAQINL